MVRWNETSRFSTDVPLLRCHRRRTEQAERRTKELLSLHDVGHYDWLDLELVYHRYRYFKTTFQRNMNCLDLILLHLTSYFMMLQVQIAQGKRGPSKSLPATWSQCSPSQPHQDMQSGARTRSAASYGCWIKPPFLICLGNPVALVPRTPRLYQFTAKSCGIG